MAVIPGQGATRAVVVQQAVPVRTVERQLEAVEVPDRDATDVAVQDASQRVIKVASPGPQGPRGDAGAVTSINGKTGDVVLDAPDVNADPEGTAIAAASSAMAMHLADPDPHGQYVADGDVLNGGNF